MALRPLRPAAAASVYMEDGLLDEVISHLLQRLKEGPSATKADVLRSYVAAVGYVRCAWAVPGANGLCQVCVGCAWCQQVQCEHAYSCTHEGVACPPCSVQLRTQERKGSMLDALRVSPSMQQQHTATLCAATLCAATLCTSKVPRVHTSFAGTPAPRVHPRGLGTLFFFTLDARVLLLMLPLP